MRVDIGFWPDADGRRRGLCVSIRLFKGRLTRVEVHADRFVGRAWGKAKLFVPGLSWATPQQVDRLALATMIALKLVPMIDEDPEKITKKRIMEKVREVEWDLTTDNPFEGR